MRRLGSFHKQPAANRGLRSLTEAVPDPFRDLGAADLPHQIKSEKTKALDVAVVNDAQDCIPVQCRRARSKKQSHIQEVHQSRVGLQRVECVMDREVHKDGLLRRRRHLQACELLATIFLPGIDGIGKAKAVPICFPEAGMYFDEDGTPWIKDSLRVPVIVSGPPEQPQVVATRSSAG